MRPVIFWASLLLAVFLAALSTRPPSPAPADAPANAFSAKRAFSTVQAIARAPHPTGSAEAARVRDEIARRLGGLGLKVETHTGTGIAQVKWLAGSAAAGHVENIVAILPGLDPSLPALAIMSHSDTVPNSPGAADNSAGVATSLEIVRALEAGGRPLRDVMVVVTDGEENGLLGAEAFFATDPAARHVGGVINMDMRGSSGRAQMFETAPDARGWTDLYRRTAKGASANALAALIYHHMPNGTDFTNAIKAGVPGLNFAFSGRQFDYHTAHATPANLDLGSVQSLGDQTLGVARAVADARTLPTPKPDGVYFEHPLLTLVHGGLVAYPAAVGWALIAVEALLLAWLAWEAIGRELASPAGAGAGALALVAMTVVAGLGLWLLGKPFGSGYTDLQQRYAVLGRYPWALAAAGLIAFGLALAILRIARRWVQPWSLWLGALALLLALAIFLQADEPTSAFILAWPLLFALLGGVGALALGGELERPGPALVIGVFAVLGASMAFSFGQAVFSAVGVDTPAALAVAVPLAAAVLIPLAAGEGGLIGAAAPVGALTLGLVSLAASGAAAGGTAAEPALTDAFFLAEPATGRFERASSMSRLDPWSRAALTADGGKITRHAEPPLFPAPIFTAAAKPIATQPVQLQAERQGGRVLLHILPGPDAREVRLRLKSSAPARDATLEGRPVTLLTRGGDWQRLNFAAPPASGLTLAFTPAPGSRLEVAAMKVVDGWPVGAKAPRRPATLQPFGFSGTTLVISRARLQW